MADRPLSGALVLLASLAAPAWAQPADTPHLDTVVVTATRHAMPLMDAPAAMTVIGREQIEARGADSVLDALRGETGIALQGRTISGRKTISLRGMDGRHTLILVDGKRIAASDGVVGHSDFQGDWIPAEDIERIEVVRGPMSVLYGAEALGGVVNIITRPVGHTWTLSALAEGTGSDVGLGGDGHRAAVRAGGPLGAQWRLAVTAADSRRQALAAAADPRLSDLEGRRKQDGAVQLAWLPTGGQRVELEHRAGAEDRWAGARERGGPRRYHQSLHDIDRRHTSLGWWRDGDGAADWRGLLRVYESAMDVANTRTEGVAALRPQKLVDRVLEGQASLVAKAGQLVTVGFEARDERLDNAGLPGGRGQASHRALFAQDEIEAGRSLAFTFGLRHDRHDRFGTEWSPRAYAVWRPAPRWTVKGGVGHGFKAPTVKQISPGYREDEGPNTFFGNADLRPETNDAVEVGVGWDAPAAGAQMMLFHNRVTDLIVPRLVDTIAGRPLYTFANLDRALLRGVETSAALVFGAGWRAALNHQFLDATDGNGQRLEKRPRHALGARLDWERGPWRAGLRVEHTRGQLLASATPGQPLQPVPALTLASAQASWQLDHGLELSVGVDNLTDLRLAEKSALFLYAETPRTFRLSLRGRW